MVSIYGLVHNGKTVNNHTVIFLDNVIYFKSYNSVIARIKNGILTLGKDYKYGRTTLKYLYVFLKNNDIDISSKKQLEQYIKINKIEILKDNIQII